MSSVAITITIVVAILCLTTLGVSLYSLKADSSQVSDLTLILAIIAIIIGVFAALTAETLHNRHEKENTAMSVQPMDAYLVTCDWRGCPATLENLAEIEVLDTLENDGWEIDGSLFNGAATYCPRHADINE